MADCSGILEDSNSVGTNLFGKDEITDSFTPNACPVVGGNYLDGLSAGMWYYHMFYSRTEDYTAGGFRSALYVA